MSRRTISMFFRYLYGTKRLITLSTSIFVVMLLFIQGIFLFAFYAERNAVAGVYDNFAGHYIYTASLIRDSPTLHSLVNDIIGIQSNLLSSYSFLERSGIAVNIVNPYNVNTNPFSFEQYYFLDSSLSSFLLNLSLPASSVVVSYDFAFSHNLNIGSNLTVFGRNFTVIDFLTFADMNCFNRYIQGFNNYLTPFLNPHKLHDIIIFNLNDLLLLSPVNESAGVTASLYFNLYYSYDSFDFSRPASTLNTAVSFDRQLDLYFSSLPFFQSSGYQSNIVHRFSIDLSSLINNDLAPHLLLYILFSLPLLIVMIYTTRLVINAVRPYWLQHLRLLWLKGFSRKQTFLLLLSLHFVVDFFVFIITFVALIVEKLVLGVSFGSASFAFYSFIFLSFLLFFLVQLRSFYQLCYPPEEFLSLFAAEHHEFSKEIELLESQKRLTKSSLLRYVLFFGLGFLFLNISTIVRFLADRLNFSAYFIYYVSPIAVILGYIIIFISIISFSLRYVIPFLHYFLTKSLKFVFNKKHFTLYRKLFRRSILRHQRLGIIIFFFFLIFSFSWLMGDTIIFEQKINETYGSNLFDVGINLNMCPNCNLSAFVNDIPNFSEVKYYSPIYWERSINIAFKGKNTLVTVFFVNTSTYYRFLLDSSVNENILSYHSIASAFQSLPSQNGSIIGLQPALLLGLKEGDKLTFSTMIGDSYIIVRTKVVDIANFNLISPRLSDTDFILLPLTLLPSSIGINNASEIHFKLKDPSSVNSFVEKLYEKYHIPLIAIDSLINMPESVSSFTSSFASFLIFIEVVAFIATVFVPILLFIDAYHSTLKYLASLYSRGFKFMNLLLALSLQLLLFYFLYASFGIILSIFFYYNVKIAFINHVMALKTYFSFNAIGRVLGKIIIVSLATILLPSLYALTSFSRERYLRDKAVSTLILLEEKITM